MLVAVVLIIMRAHKIRRHVVALAESNKVFYPRALGGRRPTNLERRRYTFNRFGCVAVKTKVIALSSGPELF